MIYFHTNSIVLNFDRGSVNKEEQNNRLAFLNSQKISSSTDGAVNYGGVQGNNLSERFEVSIKECGVLLEGWTDTAPIIVIMENNSTQSNMPWLSFVVSGEQIVLNHMNISVYALYNPAMDKLSDIVYERNQAIESKILMLRKKQNPKINNLIQIVTDLVVKELEAWVNSQQTQSIYD